jgi:hypothetical protein
VVIVGPEQLHRHGDGKRAIAVGPITSWLMQRSPCPVVVLGQHATAETELGVQPIR